MGFFAELKRRNVVRVGIAYVVAAWLLLQFAEVLYEILELPAWAPRLVILLLVIGFVPALIFAWAFEMTPEGIKREKDIDRSTSITHTTGRKLDRAIIVVLAVALAYFAYDKFSGADSEEIIIDSSPPVVAVETAAPSENVPEPAGQVDDKSIAVLPFAHRSPNADDQYFTDGIHDDLLTLLAKQDAFKVISRTSVMEYRDTTKNLKQVGEELGVRHILEGGVQRSGARIRMNVQLIDAETDEHLWAETYDRELTTDNLFDIQSEIARAIATELKATLNDSPVSSGQAAPTDSLAAYDLYIRGKQMTLGNERVEWESAVELFEEAIEIDPEFALAYIGLAEAQLTLYWSYGGDLSHRDASRISIDRAIELEPGLPEIEMAEGFYYYWGLLDYEAALTHLDRALELMPNNAEAHMWRGWTLRRSGRFEEALVSMKRSLGLNPRAPFNSLEYGQTLGYLHRFDEALAAIEQTNAMRMLELWSRSTTSVFYLQLGDVDAALATSEAALRSSEPPIRFSLWEPYLLSRNFDRAQEFAADWPARFETWRMRYFLKEAFQATAYRLAGDFEAAKAAAEQARARLLSPTSEFTNDYRTNLALAQIYAAANDRAATVEQAELALRLAPVDAVERMVDTYDMARALALVSEKDRALQLLEPLLPGPSTVSVRYVELDPHWDSLRNDPDFIALLNRYRD